MLRTPHSGAQVPWEWKFGSLQWGKSPDQLKNRQKAKDQFCFFKIVWMYFGLWIPGSRLTNTSVYFHFNHKICSRFKEEDLFFLVMSGSAGEFIPPAIFHLALSLQPRSTPASGPRELSLLAPQYFAMGPLSWPHEFHLYTHILCSYPPSPSMAAHLVLRYFGVQPSRPPWSLVSRCPMELTASFLLCSEVPRTPCWHCGFVFVSAYQIYH